MSFADYLAGLVAGDRGVKPLKEGQSRTVYSKRAPRERSWPYDWDSERSPGRTRRWEL